GGAGHHVGGAGAYGRGAGKGLQPVFHLRVARGDVDRRLFVAGLKVRQVSMLFQGLPDTGDVTVSKDAEDACKEGSFLAVAHDVLVGQILDERLRHCQPDRLHTITSHIRIVPCPTSKTSSSSPLELSARRYSNHRLVTTKTSGLSPLSFACKTQ